MAVCCTCPPSGLLWPPTVRPVEYSGPWSDDETVNQYVSLVLSGDGEWLFGATAISLTPIMRWRVSAGYHIRAPHSPHFTTLELNLTTVDGVSIAAQYTGATIVVQSSNGMYRWQLNNSIILGSYSYQSSLAASYRGRLWTASNTGNDRMLFNVLHDQLRMINT